MSKIKCKKCGDIIESLSLHDFKFCACKSVYIDGGDECTRIGGEFEDIIMMLPTGEIPFTVYMESRREEALKKAHQDLSVRAKKIYYVMETVEVDNTLVDPVYLGLAIIRKYAWETNVITGSSVNELYSLPLDELIEHNLTEEDAIKLRNCGWELSDENVLMHKL